MNPKEYVFTLADNRPPRRLDGTVFSAQLEHGALHIYRRFPKYHVAGDEDRLEFAWAPGQWKTFEIVWGDGLA